MTRMQKLTEKIKSNPRQVRFAELQLLLFAEGFIVFNQRGSHITYHRLSGLPITIVKPHGGTAYCSKWDVLKVIRILEL